MFYKDWKPFYEKIANDLKLNFEKDKDAAFLPNQFTFGPFQTFSFVFFTVTGILVLLIGAAVLRYKKETSHIYEEYEKNKQKIAEKN